MYIVIGDTYAGSMQGYGQKRKSATGFQFVGDGKYAASIMKPPQSKAKGYKPKCLMGLPWRVAFALIDELGLILRNDIIWFKPNHMPSSAKDRLTQTYEHIFHFVKAKQYYYNLDAIREPHAQIDRRTKKGLRRVTYDGKLSVLGESHSSWLGQQNPGDVLTKHDLAVGRVGNFSYTDPLHTKAYNIKGKNPGDVVSDFWSINTKPFPEAHFAVYPEAVCIRPIKASCPDRVCVKCGLPKENHPRWCPSCNCDQPEYMPGVVLDPLCGSGTTLAVAKKLGRNYIGIDINENYCEMARRRLSTIPERLDTFF